MEELKKRLEPMLKDEEEGVKIYQELAEAFAKSEEITRDSKRVISETLIQISEDEARHLSFLNLIYSML